MSHQACLTASHKYVQIAASFVSFVAKAQVSKGASNYNLTNLSESNNMSVTITGCCTRFIQDSQWWGHWGEKWL